MLYEVKLKLNVFLPFLYCTSRLFIVDFLFIYFQVSELKAIRTLCYYGVEIRVRITTTILSILCLLGLYKSR